MGLLSTLSTVGEVAGGLTSGLFGDDSSTSTSQNVSSSASTDIENLMNQLRSTASNTELSSEEKQATLENILGQMTQTIGSRAATLSQEQISLVENQLGVITSALNQTLTADYSPEKAAQISTNARQAAINDVLRAGMSEVADIEVRTGAYDSTVTKEAAVELGARAAEKGAAAELDTQKTFAALEAQRAGVLANATTNLLNVLKGAETVSEEQLVQATEQSTEGSTTSTTEQSQSTKTQEQLQSEETQSQRTQEQASTSVEQEVEEDGLLDKLFG